MSNMHMDVLFVQVVVRFGGDEEPRELWQTIYEVPDRDEENGKIDLDDSKGGPIAPGERFVVGRFVDLVNRAIEREGEKRFPRELEVRVLFFHGMFDSPHGSYRKFSLGYEGEQLRVVKPTDLHTTLLSGRFGQRQAKRWYEEALEHG